jgi:hypothetical protein
MLNFQPIADKVMTMAELCGHLTVAELRDLTNEATDTLLNLMADCTDADVTFVPKDPAAQDDYAATEAEKNMAWTLGHLIVHVTASSEESAFIAAEMARGVKREGRSRSEVDWTTIKTVAGCRQRLEESRRMRLATLDVWPAKPYLDTTVTVGYLNGEINPPARFCGGLRHETGHLTQIREVIRQAKAARA